MPGMRPIWAEWNKSAAGSLEVESLHGKGVKGADKGCSFGHGALWDYNHRIEGMLVDALSNYKTVAKRGTGRS